VIDVKQTERFNERAKRIIVPNGAFCIGECPYLSGRRCIKASAIVTDERRTLLCTDMYFGCKIYDPVNGRWD